MQTIDLKDVIIPQHLRKKPNEETIAKIRRYYFQHGGSLDEPITLDENNILVDGYDRYYVWTEVLYRTTPIAYTRKAPVVIGGKFYRGDKEYYWKNSKLLSIHVGDLVLVQNRGSISIVKVTSVYDRWNWSDEELSKSVIQNYTVDQEPWRLAIGLLNYLGVPLDDGVQFWQNVKTNDFAYQYKGGEIIPMKDYQALTFDALGWINEILTKEA